MTVWAWMAPPEVSSPQIGALGNKKSSNLIVGPDDDARKGVLMNAKKALLFFVLITFGLIHLHCAGSAPLTKEELSSRLVTGGDFALSLQDFQQMGRDMMAACDMAIAPSEAPIPAQDLDTINAERLLKMTIHFDATTYQMNTTLEGITTPVDQGTWQVIDGDTIELNNSDGSILLDVALSGLMLGITINTEQPNLDCSEPFAFDGSESPLPDVVPVVPPPPLGDTAQALQGTWCYYTGSPYYSALTIEGETIKAAYFSDNEEAGVIASTIDEASQSATVALKESGPATLLFNGTTRNYIKIKYATHVLGFFQRSTSEKAGECPGLTVP